MFKVLQITLLHQASALSDVSLAERRAADDLQQLQSHETVIRLFL